jgi:hypothetical protein
MYPCFNESERFCEEPYAGKPHVRICEGRVSKGICLLDYRGEIIVDTDTLLFFDKNPSALPLYEVLETKTYALFPAAKKRVQKTQISFSNRHIFACVSFAQVKKKAELPCPYLVLTLGLPYPLDSDRVAVKTEPYPGRWTTHIVIGTADEIDEEIFSWIHQAYVFSEIK